jgi:hypothetical protein
VTAGGLLGAGAVLLGFVAAAWLLLPVVTRRRLGVLHPAVAWLALEGFFFGVGSLALALGEDRPGAALYLGACVLAVAVGARLADRYGPFAAGAPIPDPSARPIPETGRRRWVPAVMAVVAVALLTPTLIEIGVPLFSHDATVARTALTGIPIQVLRVAIPGLASILLLEWLAGRPAAGRPAVTLVVIGLLVALTIGLASRYLAIELVACMVLAWLLTGRSVPARAAAIAALVGVVGFVAIGVLRAPRDFATDTAAVAAQRTISRLFLVEPRTLDALQATIPVEEPYFLGLTWLRRVGPIVGRDDIPNLGYWIYPKVVDEAQDVAGYAAPGLIGEAWANFGPAGIAIFVVFGMGLEALAAWVASHRARVLDIAAAALAILFVARTHALGLLGGGLLLALVAGWWALAGARLHRTEVRPTAPGQAVVNGNLDPR